MLDWKFLKKNRINKKAGIYMITPFDNSDPNKPMNNKIIIKIGMSSNLASRLDQYHTCMPDSFWIYSLLICKDVYYARKLERQIHEILRGLDKLYKHKEYNAREVGEWFELTKGELLNIMSQIVKNDEYGIRDVYNIHKSFQIKR